MILSSCRPYCIISCSIKPFKCTFDIVICFKGRLKWLLGEIIVFSGPCEV